MTFDLVVRNGRLVDGGEMSDLDIGVRDGIIQHLGPDMGPGDTDIDAGGRYVVPGGVDSHVHLGQLSSTGNLTADDFWTGSRSAAHGGTTTIIPFAAQHRGMRIRNVYDDASERARREMTTDYGFQLIVTDPDVEHAADDLQGLAGEGITGIKIYLTYDRLRLDGRKALDTMAQAAALGLTVMVHAEQDDIVSWGRDREVAAGELGAFSHARSHSRAAERAGVATAIALAEESGAQLILAHLSLPDSIDMVTQARRRGVAVFAETCPHYLVLDEAMLSQPMEQAAPFMCSPPLRSRHEVEDLREALSWGDIDIVASDHSPYTAAQKTPAGANTPFTDVANGLPGIELRLALLYTVTAAQSGISPVDFVRVACANPAKVAGMYPRKGSLRVGADADLVIWDSTSHTVRYADLHDAVGYTPYEGMTVAGRPATVISRGEVLVSEDVDNTRPGKGRFIPRMAPGS